MSIEGIIVLVLLFSVLIIGIIGLVLLMTPDKVEKMRREEAKDGKLQRRKTGSGQMDI